MSKKDSEPLLPVSLLRLLILVVAFLWAGSLILQAFNPNYSPPDTLGLAFMAILSAILGASSVKRRREELEDEEDDRKKDKASDTDVRDVEGQGD